MTSNKIFSGAALGSLLGTMAALIYPQRNGIREYINDHSDHINYYAKKARDYGNSLFNRGSRQREIRYNYLKSGLVGVILGAGAALLLAPKSGKALRGQLTKAYNDISEKSEGFVHHFKSNAHYPFSDTHYNGVKKKRPTLKTTIKTKKTPHK
jgi:gas vesicle protein